MQRQHREGQVEALLIRGHSASRDVPACDAEDSAEDCGSPVPDHDLNEAGNHSELSRQRRDIHLHGRVVGTVGKSVLRRNRPSRGPGLGGLVDEVAGPSERGGVGRVLLISALQQHLPAIKGKGCDHHDDKQAQGEDDDDLPANGFHVSC